MTGEGNKDKRNLSHIASTCIANNDCATAVVLTALAVGLLFVRAQLILAFALMTGSLDIYDDKTFRIDSSASKHFIYIYVPHQPHNFVPAGQLTRYSQYQWESPDIEKLVWKNHVGTKHVFEYVNQEHI